MKSPESWRQRTQSYAMNERGRIEARDTVIRPEKRVPGRYYCDGRTPTCHETQQRKGESRAKPNRPTCQQRKTHAAAPIEPQTRRLRFRFTNSQSPKPRGIAGFSRSIWECMREVSATEDSMAEREGFEPSIGVTYTPLAGARLQPLGHLSGTRESTESRRSRDP